MTMEMAELGRKTCPECGALNQLGARYCDQCATAFPQPQPASPVAWRVVNRWRSHYAENGYGAETAEAAVAAFNLTVSPQDMAYMGHLDYVAAQLESTDDPLVFRVLAWRPLTPDRAAGEFLLGDPVEPPEPTVTFSPLEGG